MTYTQIVFSEITTIRVFSNMFILLRVKLIKSEVICFIEICPSKNERTPK